MLGSYWIMAKRETTELCWGYIGIMEKKIETTISHYHSPGFELLHQILPNIASNAERMINSETA